MTMNPSEFEFTDSYLVFLGYHAFSSKYYEFTHLNSLSYLNLQTSSTAQTATGASEKTVTDLVSVFSKIIDNDHLNKLY